MVHRSNNVNAVIAALALALCAQAMAYPTSMERGSADNNYVALRNSSPRDLDRLIDLCNDRECDEQNTMDKTNNEDNLIGDFTSYANLCDGDGDDCGSLSSVAAKRSLDRLKGGFVLASKRSNLDRSNGDRAVEPKRSSLYRLIGDSVDFAELCDDDECDVPSVAAKRSSLNRLNGGHVMKSKRNSLDRLSSGHVMANKRYGLDKLNGNSVEISKAVNAVTQSLRPYDIHGALDRFNPSFVHRPLRR